MKQRRWWVENVFEWSVRSLRRAPTQPERCVGALSLAVPLPRTRITLAQTQTLRTTPTLSPILIKATSSLTINKAAIISSNKQQIVWVIIFLFLCGKNVRGGRLLLAGLVWRGRGKQVSGFSSRLRTACALQRSTRTTRKPFPPGEISNELNYWHKPNLNKKSKLEETLWICRNYFTIKKLF